jgi:glycosyltransferase involved in cell wall biosynthesis
MPPQTLPRRTIAFFLPDFSGGGAERMTLNLVNAMQKRENRVILVVTRASGELSELVGPGVEIVSLNRPGTIAAIDRLVAFLSSYQPDVLISAFGHNNIIALWAKAIARVPTRIIIQQHNVMSMQALSGNWRFRLLPWLYRWFAPWADAVVAVSEGAAADVIRLTGLSREAVEVIPNPVISENFEALAERAVEHDFFAPGAPPVFLSVGRLVPVKDHQMALDAFALVRAQRRVRLMFLGDGPLRAALEVHARSLHIEDDVAFAGFVNNPIAYMPHAAALLLSSKHEGFGAVLVEALATGTAVVATDCPYGPAEILEGGRYGRLTPVGDSAAFAKAMLETLDSLPDRASLRERAREYTTGTVVTRYETLIDRLLAR